MLSYLKRRYLSGIGFAISDEEAIENKISSEKETVTEINNTPSRNIDTEHKSQSQPVSISNNNTTHTKSSEKSQIKTDNKTIVDYRRSHINKTNHNSSNNNNTSSSSLNSSSPKSTHTLKNSSATHSVNNVSKSTKNEISYVNKKSTSSTKPDIKRPSSSLSKRQNSTIPKSSENHSTTSGAHSTLNRTNTKKPTHVSSLKKSEIPKKTEVPKKSSKYDTVSNLNSLKKNNTQNQVTTLSTIKRNNSLNALSSSDSTKKDTSSPTSYLRKQINTTVAAKKTSTLSHKSSSTVPLKTSAVAISKKKEDTTTTTTTIPKIPSPLQTLNNNSPVTNLYEIVNKYKKLNEPSSTAVQDKKLKRSTLDFYGTPTETKTKTKEIKRSATLNNLPTKEEGGVKRSNSINKEESRDSEKFNTLKKPLSTFPVSKASSLTKSIIENKKSIAAINLSTEENDLFSKLKIETLNARIANLNNTIENRNKRSSVSNMKNIIESKEKKNSISTLKNIGDNTNKGNNLISVKKDAERINSDDSPRKTDELNNKMSTIPNISSAIEKIEKKSSVENLKNRNNMDVDNKQRNNIVENLKNIIESRNKKNSVENLKNIIESKNKKNSVENLKNIIESKNKNNSVENLKSKFSNSINQPIKIKSKENKSSTSTNTPSNPKSSLLFNGNNNEANDDISSSISSSYQKEEFSLKEDDPLVVNEIDSDVEEEDNQSSLESFESIPPFNPLSINILSDQISEGTLASQNDDFESPLSSAFTSPTLINSRKSSLASPSLSNIGTINMNNFGSGGLKKKRSGWWDNIKDKNEEKQSIKDSIRSLPMVNIKTQEPEAGKDNVAENHQNGSNADNSYSNGSIRVASPSVDDDIYKRSMNEVEFLMNKAKLVDQNESILQALEVVLHFCKENGFTKTLDALKEESKYYTNSENTKNLKKYLETSNFDLAIDYVKGIFSKYRPSDLANYEVIESSYNDLLYVLYRYYYLYLIQKRKTNEAKNKILNVVMKKRVIQSYAVGGDYTKYFEDDNFYLSELLIRGPLSSTNPYKSFKMNIHLKQFWTKSYAEKDVLNYWPFLEMFFNSKDEKNVNSYSPILPLNGMIKLTKGVQDVIDSCNNGNTSANGINDSRSIKSHQVHSSFVSNTNDFTAIATPTATAAITANATKEYQPSTPLKHGSLLSKSESKLSKTTSIDNFKLGRSESKLSRTNSVDSFKSVNSLRSRLLRESSKSNIKLNGALPPSLINKASNGSLKSDFYNTSFKSVNSSVKGHVLSKKTSQVFDEESTSNSKPINRLNKTRLMGINRSHSVAGTSTNNHSNKRNSLEWNDYHVHNHHNSFHGGDFPNFNMCATPTTIQYVEDDSISFNTLSDNNSIYSLTSCDWLNFNFDGFIGPYAGGIRAMDVQYTSKKDAEGQPIEGVFGQLVVAVAIDSNQDHSISIWDVHNKTCLAKMSNNKTVEIIKFHPTLPNVFLTSDQDFDIKLWDWTKGTVDANGNYHIEPLRVWKKFHKRIIHKIDFLPDQPMNAISCSSDNTIQIWNIESDDKNNNVKRIVSNNPISAFTFANGNRYLVAASMYILRIYDMETLKLVNTIELEDLKSSKMTINYMETHITNDNLLLLSCASNIILYDLASTSGVRVFDSPYISLDQKIEGHFSPYGQYVYSSSIIPRYFASLPTTENPPNFPTSMLSHGVTISDMSSTGSLSYSHDQKEREGTGFYIWNVDSGRFEQSSIKQMEKDVEPYLSSHEKVSVCQWINVPCINDPDTNAQIFIVGTTDKVLRFYSFCDCHLTD